MAVSIDWSILDVGVFSIKAWLEASMLCWVWCNV